jgi:hypothetical protein
MPLKIDRPGDRDAAVRHLATGAVVAVAFGNFYAVVTDPSADAVRGVNRAKGRPVDQVGSITTGPARIGSVFDFGQVPAALGADRVRTLMDTLLAIGPFGFRGPAATHLPDHLTQLNRGVRTTRLISPGTACPSNAFIDRAVTVLGVDHLAITSANRSRHLTGADEEPAHWRAAAIAADFTHVPDLTILAHPDEAAARAAYPSHRPCSVTVLSFHSATMHGDRPVLTVDRHGSLALDAVRRAASPLGIDITAAPTAVRPLTVRSYDDALRPTREFA